MTVLLVAELLALLAFGGMAGMAAERNFRDRHYILAGIGVLIVAAHVFAMALIYALVMQ